MASVFLVPVLGADVIQFRAATDHEVVHATGESSAAGMSGAKMLDHGDLRQLVGDQERVGKTLAFSPWSQWKISMGSSTSTPFGT